MWAAASQPQEADSCGTPWRPRCVITHAILPGMVEALWESSPRSCAELSLADTQRLLSKKLAYHPEPCPAQFPCLISHIHQIAPGS